MLVHLASGVGRALRADEGMLESLSQLESLTPSFSFCPLGLKKCVFSHQFILCGLSYKNAPAGFSIRKTCFSFVETYIIFFVVAAFLLCCFKLKANVLPSPSFLLPHPHLCMFQLQSCENKSSFGFCYFKTASVMSESILKALRMLAECNAAAIQHDAGNGVESIKAFHIPRAHNCLRPWL